MYKTEIQGTLFVYDSFTGNGKIAHHLDAWHMTELVFYNYILNMVGKRELTVPQFIYHLKCVEAFNRATQNIF